MNFDEAITAHSQWRIRLQSVIAGTSKEDLDPAVVCRDDKCALGQWIYGEAKIYVNLLEYDTLKISHAEFHQSAAQVLRLSAAGKLAEATAIMKEGAFHQASLRTITAIRKLRLRIAA